MGRTLGGVLTLLIVTLLLTFLAGNRMTLRRLGCIEATLDDVAIGIANAQAAHQHQVDSLTRRMRGVESSAATAEREARLVSMHLTDLTRGLAQHLVDIPETNPRSTSDG